MRFAYPQMLWLLTVTLPLLIWFLVWAWRKRLYLRTLFVQSRLLPQLTDCLTPGRDKFRLGLITVSVALILLALARPQWGYDWEEVTQRGLDIMVAIDTSRSMLAEDVRPNRLERAKLAALDLMALAKRDRMGLIVFAGTAFLQCPLTLDDEAFRQNIEAVNVGIMPQGGTALSEAIAAALDAFKESTNFKILVLFTDGEDHDGEVQTQVDQAAEAGLRIFTVGVGTPNGEVLRVTDDQGEAQFVKDEQGQVVKSRLNEPLLQQMATATSGFYLPLRSAQVMETLYEQGLAPLPKSELSSRLYRQYRERFYWPLGFALLLLILETLIPGARRATATRPSSALPVAKASLLIGMLIGAGLLTTPLAASPTRAQRAYQQGDFETAVREYQGLLEQSPDDPRLYFNAGTAAYQARDFDQAARFFTNALTAPDLALQQQTFYNLGDTLYRLGENTPDPQEKQQLWENAVRSFDGAVKLRTNDLDAQFNLDFVKRKLEELEQQQQEQQSDDESNNESDDQSSPDSSQEKQDSQPENDSENPPDESQSGEQPDSQPDPNDPQQQEEETAPPEDPNQDQDSKSPPESQPQPKDGSPDGQPQPANSEPGSQPLEPGQMTIPQAEQLLDAQKGEERALIFIPPQPSKRKTPSRRQW